jgi:para-aminobenzoate synthetase/4-amino-4-deoxychorismate lyase
MIAPGSVFLHDNLTQSGRNYAFSDPSRMLIAHEAGDIPGLLEGLAAARQEGLWVAGYLSYELGLCLEERLEGLMPPRRAGPLAWFGCYDAPQILGASEAAEQIAKWRNDAAAINGLTPMMPFSDYRHAFEKVQAYIAAGDVYQVNLTFPARFSLTGRPEALYQQLCRSQPVAYGALIDTGEETVLSRSPELFVGCHNGRLSARPMKGTMARGRTTAEDEQARAFLRSDEKSRAENLMIVDLLRNDIGRIAEIGSVEVTDLFTVETYKSVHQMTSGIEADLKPGMAPEMALMRLFPCGSITGAPKIRAMEIIAECEPQPRGVYTGAIGMIAPDGDFIFNVAIRTAVIGRDGSGRIGIGGGLVADSIAKDEYDEALLKMKFISAPAPEFDLIETLLWTEQDGYELLDRHLDRLSDSAAYFQIPLQWADAARILGDAVEGFPEPRMRVRLLLNCGGQLSISAVPLQAPSAPLRYTFKLARERMQSSNPFLFHKTTNRAFYDNPRARAVASEGVDELVFCNEKSELTEGAITNLFVERHGELLTPSLASGLLPGTLRAELLAKGMASEAILTPVDLKTAEAIYLGNSVRGLIPAEYLGESG